MHHLHGYEFEAFLFEPLNNFAHQSSLNGIRLEHDKGAFSVSSHVYFFRITRELLTCCQEDG